MSMSGGSARAEAEWPDLSGELDRWGEAGRVAAVWWRDDDAVAATPRLARLLDLAGDVPLALAVIPAAVEDELAAVVAQRPQLSVLPHGWCHANHAVTGKKSEFPAGRPRDDAATDLAAAWQRVASLFGGSACPVFVPPWNRFAEKFVPLLAEAAIAGLSLMAPRRYAAPTPGIAALDVDVDLVDWRGGRGFVGTGAALAGVVRTLRARREAPATPSAAAAILTHHLVLDEEGADFLLRFRETIEAHPAVRWAATAELLAR